MPRHVLFVTDMRLSLTPMEMGLRVGGNVEFAGLGAAPDFRRLNRVRAAAFGATRHLRLLILAAGVDVRHELLEEIARFTKINPVQLQAIEDENFGELPAVVYLRGFITEIAKFLKLDPTQVARTYLRRHSQWRSETNPADRA